ncbi:protein BIG GRAIN 1-like A [Juglans microcarpa x Juglans regia]|uniref:protein BIG GRAIN 1-like A n=1 Tax=Juglans microcarpa x Juglans regia TaxID=2249226 RepID=UPI001B7F0ACF|nr:protein BIG GRAIN 1-like A [Juglans microcarpa x Juglans regia]
MDRWGKSLREDRHRHRRDNPSFSSTLLDTIYQSIDEGHGKEREEEIILYRETMRKKQSDGLKGQKAEIASFRRPCMIDNYWIDRKVKEKVSGRRNSTADLERKSRDDRGFMLQNSSSSSSESSSGAGFSSSESEPVHASKPRASCYSMQRPKPIRTGFSEKPLSEKFGGGYGERSDYISSSTQKPKHENGFVKTKSKALKIYGDLKKVKQPISPGGRLASFLNSLFTAGNAKKEKMSSSSVVGGYDSTSSERKSKSTTTTSTCSSASSFSRSCLITTPPTRSKFSNSTSGAKRSVRFCPVSVIVDEDCRPCGHKSLPDQDKPGIMAVSTIGTEGDEEIKCYVMSGNYRVEEVTKDGLFKNYHKEKQNMDMREVVLQDHDNGDSSEEEDDDDAASCSSSDLFELDNLSGIGIERYREELPVYETTHFDTNRAIANGLIM